MTADPGGRQGGVLNRSSATFALLGGALVIAGGIVAAVDSAAPFAHGSWLAAYLVLVAGVSQVLLGLGRLALPVREPPQRLTRGKRRSSRGAGVFRGRRPRGAAAGNWL